MIIEGIIGILIGIVELLLAPLQILQFRMPEIVLSNMIEIFALVGYILPIPQLMPIILAFFALMSFRIIVTLIKTVWDLLPIV